MTGHCMLRQGPSPTTTTTTTTPPQTCAQQSPNFNHSSSQPMTLAPSLQHEFPTSPTLSSDIPQNPTDASDAELTPPTSSSGFSSQDRPTFGAQDNSTRAFESTNPDALLFLTSKPPANGLNGAGSPMEHIAASKRTSSGQLKRSSTSDSDALKSSHGTASGHSRTPSLLSNGSNITELSQQLRTRLSYAMVKVQNGWESNTLEEIENLTLQHGSSRSSLAATSFASKQQPSPSSRITLTPSLRRRGSSSVSFEAISAPGGNSLADHRASGDGGQQPRLVNGSQRRALAPPADIVSGARRRPHHANALPNGYRSVKPQRPTGPKQRTASQNAAMEADAVETLLFMASPGNSGHNPSSAGGMASSARMSAPTSLQASPLKWNFSGEELLASPPRRVAFTGLPETIPRTADVPAQFDIDRMIDDMDDGSTDSDLEYMNAAIVLQPGVDHAVPI